MSFQPEPGTIDWKMHFASSREKAFAALATDAGCAGYWAESAAEVDGTITFHILNYEPFAGRVLRNDKPSTFTLEYFGTVVQFSLQDDGNGGNDLALHAPEVGESIRMEMLAGWVSVLMR